MRDTLPPLALIHDGDSYVLTLSAVGQKCVKILQILRFAHNENNEPTEEYFHDLDYDTKRAIIAQCNRRFSGKTVIT